ncbi:MAG: hypothetical protein LBI86_00995 [Treponema sp.]|nr:hypothetical protein [Treponema sp.]
MFVKSLVIIRVLNGCFPSLLLEEIRPPNEGTDPFMKADAGIQRAVCEFGQYLEKEKTGNGYHYYPYIPGIARKRTICNILPYEREKDDAKEDQKKTGRRKNSNKVYARIDDIWEKELGPLLKKELVDVFRFFLKKEDEQFACGLREMFDKECDIAAGATGMADIFYSECKHLGMKYELVTDEEGAGEEAGGNGERLLFKWKSAMVRSSPKTAYKQFQSFARGNYTRCYTGIRLVLFYNDLIKENSPQEAQRDYFKNSLTKEDTKKQDDEISGNDFLWVVPEEKRQRFKIDKNVTFKNFNNAAGFWNGAEPARVNGKPVKESALDPEYKKQLRTVHLLEKFGLVPPDKIIKAEYLLYSLYYSKNREKISEDPLETIFSDEEIFPGLKNGLFDRIKIPGMNIVEKLAYGFYFGKSRSRSESLRQLHGKLFKPSGEVNKTNLDDCFIKLSFSLYEDFFEQVFMLRFDGMAKKAGCPPEYVRVFEKADLRTDDEDEEPFISHFGSGFALIRDIALQMKKEEAVYGIKNLYDLIDTLTGLKESWWQYELEEMHRNKSLPPIFNDTNREKIKDIAEKISFWFEHENKKTEKEDFERLFQAGDAGEVVHIFEYLPLAKNIVRLYDRYRKDAGFVEILGESAGDIERLRGMVNIYFPSGYTEGKKETGRDVEDEENDTFEDEEDENDGEEEIADPNSDVPGKAPWKGGDENSGAKDEYAYAKNKLMEIYITYFPTHFPGEHIGKFLKYLRSRDVKDLIEYARPFLKRSRKYRSLAESSTVFAVFSEIYRDSLNFNDGKVCKDFSEWMGNVADEINKLNGFRKGG